LPGFSRDPDRQGVARRLGEQRMIYLATYNHKRRQVQHSDRKSKRLVFIEAEGRLALDKVIALIKKLTDDDLEEASVEIIGQKAYDAKKINNPLIKFHKLD